MRNTVKVLVNCPNPQDATSLYRGVGPLGTLRRQDDRIQIESAMEYYWGTFKLHDLLFIQRPYNAKHLMAIQMAKDNNVPVWIDYDDDLFSVPQSNPAHRVYNKDDVRKTVATCIATADVVTVSTQYLKDQFQKGPQALNKDIRVIPNAFDDDLLRYRTKPNQERRRLMAWRGSNTHQSDLHSCLPQIVDAVNKDSTWTWLFQGDAPWFLTSKLGNNAIFAEPLDPIVYFKQMHEMKPSVMIVPLEDNTFNRSKSNIAWMESAFFGGMTIAPQWDEWKRPGCVNYASPDEFGRAIQDIMKGVYNPTDMAEEAWAYIQENLLLSRVNEMRLQVIQDLLG